VTLLADLDAFFQEHRRCGDLDTSRTRAVAWSQALHPLAAEDDIRRRGVGNPLSFPELNALQVRVFAMA
jgi:hypothetical protein